MDLFYPIQSPRSFFPILRHYHHRFLFHSYAPQHSSHVRWVETPESHLYRADLPDTRKEDIRVEVEDSRYLVIRTERSDSHGGSRAAEEEEGRRGFMRKFRLPELVDVESIAAEFVDGVLRIMVPRMTASRWRRLNLDDAEMPDSSNVVAPAA